EKAADKETNIIAKDRVVFMVLNFGKNK
ncbi:MAG: hypothetical protein RL037_754, partial [Bacteroidota bacterium]